MFNLTNVLQKYHTRSSISALILLLAVSCAQPPSGVPTEAELGTAVLNFQILPAEVGSVDVELIPSNPTIAKGVNQELYRKTMVIPEGLAQLAARPTQLQFQNIPVGSYKAKVQAHMRYQTTTLYTAANAIEVRKISTQGVIAPGAKTEITAIPVQTIALERAQGEVKVQVNQPTIANLPTLVYTAQVGSFRTPLTLKDGVLSGTITGIPTAPGHILLIEGRDAAGTLMLQGNKRVNVDMATTQQTVDLQQIAFGHREPENPDVQNLASTNVTEAFKVKVNTSCGECMGNLTNLVVHWGDGNSQYIAAQNGVLPTDLEHVYSNAGAQVLSITAFDRAGVAAQTSKLVTTNDPKIQVALTNDTLVQFVVNNVPANARKLKAKLIPMTQRPNAGGREAPTTIEPITLELSKTENPKVWDGISRLARGVTWKATLETALPTRMLASREATEFRTTDAGQVQNLEFKGLLSKSPSDNIRLEIYPQAGILNQSDAGKEFYVRGFKQTGEEVDIENEIEWMTSDANSAQITTNTFTKTTVKALVPTGSAFISARLKDRPEVISEPAFVMIASLNSGVIPIPDDKVIFPPLIREIDSIRATNGFGFDFSDISLNGNDMFFGPFKDSDIFPLVNLSYDEKKPNLDTSTLAIVVKNTKIHVGDTLIASESGKFYGSVMSVEEIENFSLVKISIIPTNQLFNSINISFSPTQLERAGIVSSSYFNDLRRNSIKKFASRSIAQNKNNKLALSKKLNQNQFLLNAKSPVKDDEPLECKLNDWDKDRAGKVFVPATFSGINITPKIGTVGDLQINLDNKGFKIGWDKLTVTGSLIVEIKPNLSLDYTCTYHMIDIPIKAGILGALLSPSAKVDLSLQIIAQAGLNVATIALNTSTSGRLAFDTHPGAPSNDFSPWVQNFQHSIVGGNLNDMVGGNSNDIGVLPVMLQGGLLFKLQPKIDYGIGKEFSGITEYIKKIIIEYGKEKNLDPKDHKTYQKWLAFSKKRYDTRYSLVSLDIGPEMQFVYNTRSAVLMNSEAYGIDPLGNLSSQTTLRPMYAKLEVNVPIVNEVLGALKAIAPGFINVPPRLGVSFEGNLFNERQLISRPTLLVGKYKNNEGKTEKSRITNLGLTKSDQSTVYEFDNETPLPEYENNVKPDLLVNKGDKLTLRSFIKWEEIDSNIFANAPAIIPIELDNVEVWASKDRFIEVAKLVSTEKADIKAINRSDKNNRIETIQPFQVKFKVNNLCDNSKGGQAKFYVLAKLKQITPILQPIDFYYLLTTFNYECGVKVVADGMNLRDNNQLLPMPVCDNPNIIGFVQAKVKDLIAKIDGKEYRNALYDSATGISKLAFSIPRIDGFRFMSLHRTIKTDSGSKIGSAFYERQFEAVANHDVLGCTDVLFTPVFDINGWARAGARGDPHIGTFDGPRVSVHALGEFDYIRPEDTTRKEPRLQVRHELQRPGKPFANATALAFRYRGHTVEVRGKAPYLRIDGLPSDYKFLELEKGFTVEINQDSGTGKIFTPNTFVDFVNSGGALNILARAPQKTPIVGLMGSPDGIPGNNRAAPNGSIVPASNGEIALGEAWRVPKSESLFSYDDGAYESFNKKNVYLNQLPSPDELAPFLERASTLLAGSCAVGVETDAGLQEAALDLYAGMTQTDVMGHFCQYQVFGKVKNKNALEIPFIGSTVKMLSSELGSCEIASDASGYFSCVMAPKPNTNSLPNVALDLDGEKFTVAFDRLAKPGEILSFQQDLEVSPTTLHLKGTVLDPEGHPVRSARIQIFAAGQLRTVSTNDQGVYDLYVAFTKAQADRDLLYDIVASSPGLKYVKRAGVRLIANGLKEVTEDLQMSRSIKFSGVAQNTLLPGHTLGGVLTIRRVGGVQLCKVQINGHTRVESDQLASTLEYASVGDHGSSSTEYFVASDSFHEYKYPDAVNPMPTPDGKYACIGEVNSLAALDLEYELKGDWGQVIQRVQVPAKDVGAAQEEEPFAYDLEVQPRVVRVSGQVLNSAGQAQALFAGLLTDNKLFAADASFRMGLAATGFEFAAVLKEGVTAGQFRLQSQGVGGSGVVYGQQEYKVAGAAAGTIAEITGNLTLGERTVEFTGVLKNALTDSGIPGEVVISSPQVGELCRATAYWQATGNLAPGQAEPPVGTYACTATIKQFGDLDLVYQANGNWGNNANALRDVLPASSSGVARDVVVRAPVLHVSGVVKNRIGEAVVGAVVVPSGGDVFDPTFMERNELSSVITGVGGAYSLDLLLKLGSAASGQFDVEASQGGVKPAYGYSPVSYANASAANKLDVLANIDISGGRVVKFTGAARNGHLEKVPLRGRVVVRHVGGAEVCSAQVDAAGQYACTVVLESTALFTVTHLFSGDWGESTGEPVVVPEGRANTVLQDVQAFPTTVEVAGRVRDTGDVQVSGGLVSLLGDTGFLSGVSTSEFQTGLRGEYRLVLVLKPNATRAKLEVLARYFKAEGKNLIDVQNVAVGEFKHVDLDLLVARPVQISGVLTNRFVPSMTLPGVVKAKLADGSELCQGTAAADGKFTCFGRVTTSGPVSATFTVNGFWGSASQTASIPAGPAYSTSESVQNLNLDATTIKFVGQLIDSTTNSAPYKGQVRISGAGMSPLDLNASATGAYEGFALVPSTGTISVLWQARDTANNLATKTLGITPVANAVTNQAMDLRLETREPGSARWANLTGGRFIAAPAIGADGTLYYLGVVNSTQLKLHAVAIDGSPRWEQVLGTVSDSVYATHSPPMVGADGTIFVAHDGELIAVRPDASIRWRYVFDVKRADSGKLAALHDGGVALLRSAYLTGNESELILFENTGTVRQSRSFGTTIARDISIASDDTFYVQVGQDLIALNPDLSRRWKIPSAAPLALGANGEMYINKNGTLEVLNSDLKKQSQSSVSPHQVIVSNDQVYALSSNTLYALRPDGSIRWQRNAEAGVQFQTLTAGNDGLIYVAAIKSAANAQDSGLTFAFDSVNAETWRFASALPVNQISMGVDGTVNVGGDKLYAINSTATAPAIGAWIQKHGAITSQNTAPVNTNPRRLIRVFGTVQNANVVGQTLEGYQVRVNRNDGSVFCNAVTDAHGQYDCAAPAALGESVLQLELQGAYGLFIRDFTVPSDVNGSVTASQQDAALAVTTLEVQGTVVDNNQKPVPNATVKITGQITDALTTSADGRFKGVYLFAADRTQVTATLEVSDGVAVVTNAVNFTVIPKVLTKVQPIVTINPTAIGATRWHLKLPGEVVTAPALAANGSSYVTTKNGFLVEITKTGQLGKSIQLSAPSQFAPTIAADGTIYVAVGSTLEAFNAAGDPKWTYTATSALTATVVLDHEDRPVLATRDAMISLETSKALRWKFDTTDAPTQLAIGGDGTVYAFSNGVLRALEAGGNQRWTRTGIETTFAIATTGYPVFVGSNAVMWLDANGDVTRSVALPHQSVRDVLALEDGRIFVATDSQIVAISQSGVLKSYGSAPASRLVMGSDGVLHTLDASQIRAFGVNGDELWKAAGNPIINPVPVLTTDQLLLVILENDNFVAINTSSAAAALGWSRFGANAQNTGKTRGSVPASGRTLNFSGTVANQFNLSQKLAGFDITIRDANGKLLCQTSSTATGAYACVSAIIPTDALIAKYVISKRLSSTDLNSSELVVPIAAASVGDRTDIIQTLVVPISTVQLFGVVKNGDKQILPNASILIQTANERDVRTTSDSTGHYETLLSYEPIQGRRLFTIIGTNGTETTNQQIEVIYASHQYATRELNLTIGARIEGQLSWIKPELAEQRTPIVFDSADAIYTKTGIFNTAGDLQVAFSSQPLAASSIGVLTADLALYQPDGKARWNLGVQLSAAAASNDGFHVVTAERDRYMAVNGNGVILRSNMFINGWKVLGAPLTRADGSAIVLTYLPTGALRINHFNSDGSPQTVFQTQAPLSVLGAQLDYELTQQLPVLTPDGEILLYTKGSTSSQLTKFSAIGTTTWQSAIASIPFAAPVIAATGEITLALGQNLITLDSNGLPLTTLDIQPLISSIQNPRIRGIALGVDGTKFLNVNGDKTAVLAIKSDGTKRWAFERVCGSIASDLEGRTIRVAQDGTVLTQLCSSLVALNSSTLGVASGFWSGVGRNNQNSNRLEGDGISRRTIYLSGKVSNQFLPGQVFANQKVTVRDSSDALICQVFSDASGLYQCGIDLNNRNAMTWKITVEDEYGTISKTVPVAAGEFNTRLELEQDLPIPAKTLQLQGTLKLADSNLAVGKTVSFKLGNENAVETISGSDGTYAYTFVYRKAQTILNPEIRFSDAGVEAVAKPYLELLPEAITSKTVDLQLGVQAGGTERWNLNLPYVSSIAMAADQTFRVATGDRTISALKADKTLLWSKQFDIYPSAMLVDANGVTYVVGDNRLLAINPDGSTKFYLSNLPSGAQGLTQLADQTIIVSSYKAVTAIDKNAKLIWNYDLANGNFTTAPVLLANGNIGIGSTQAIVTMDSAGKFVSSLATPSIQTLIASEDSLIASSGSSIRGFKDNVQSWAYNAAVNNVQTIVTASDGSIYLSENTSLVALNRDGTLRWRKEAGTKLGAIAVGQDGVIHVVGDTGLLSFNPDNSIRWTAASIQYPSFISPVIASDGSVVFAANNRLISDYTDSRGLANSWARQTATNQNTNTLVISPKDPTTRIVKFRGLVSNRFIPGSLLSNYLVEVTRQDGSFLCNATSDANGNYECSSLLENAETNVQYHVSGALITTNLTSSVPSGATLEQSVNLELPITTLKIEGVVQDTQTPAQGIANATVAITAGASGTTTTGISGSYTFSLPFAEAQTQADLTLKTTANSNSTTTIISTALVVNTLNTISRNVVVDDRALGAVARTVALEGSIVGSPLVLPDGKIIVGSTQGVFEIAADGSELWRYTDHRPRGQIRMDVSDQSLVFSDGYRLVKLHVANGQKDWIVTGYDFVLAIAADGSLIVRTSYVTNSPRPLYRVTALDAQGAFKWDTDIQASGESSAAFAPNGSLIVTDSVRLFAVNPDGSIHWKKDFNYQDNPTLTITPHRIWLSGYQTQAFDYDGNLKWSSTQTSAVSIDETGQVFFTKDNKLNVIDETGIPLWDAPVTNPTRDIPVLGNDQTRYVITSTGVTATGSDKQLQWNYAATGAIQAAVPVSGRFLLVANGNKLLWLNATSTKTATSMWSTRDGDPLATRTTPSDGIARRLVEIKGKVQHAYIPGFAMNNYSVSVKDGATVLCTTTTTATGDFSCVFPSGLNAISASLEASGAYGDVSATNTVAAGSANSRASVSTTLTVQPITVRLIGQVEDANHQALGNATVRLLNSTGSVSRADGTSVLYEWSPIDSQSGYTLQSDPTGQYEVWLTLPKGMNDASATLQSSNSSTGVFGSITINAPVNNTTLNTINTALQLQQSGLKIQGQIARPNGGQPYANVAIEVNSPVQVIAQDVNGQSLGTGYNFKVVSDLNGRYAITFSYLGSVTDVSAHLNADIVGNSIQRDVAATITAGQVTSKTEDFSFDNAQNGVSRWKMGFPSFDPKTTPAVATDGTIYFTQGSFIYALDASGHQLWKTNLCDACSDYYRGLGTPVIRPDGRIVVLDGRSNLHILDQNGGIYKSYSLGSAQKTSDLAVDQNNITYLVTDTDGIISVSDIGEKIWSSRARTDNDYSANLGKVLIAPDRTIYFVASADGRYHSSSVISAFNFDGSPRWQLDNDLRFESAALSADGSLYVSAGRYRYINYSQQLTENHFLKVSVSGKVLWDRVINNGNPNITSVGKPIILQDGRILLSDGSVFDDAGNLLGNLGVNADFVTNDGLIYGHDSAGFHAYTLTGTSQWSFANGLEVAVLGSSGTALIASSDGIRAINIASNALANSNWPTPNKNQSNTSAMPYQASLKRLVKIQGTVKQISSNQIAYGAEIRVQTTSGEVFCTTTSGNQGEYSCGNLTDTMTPFDLEIRVLRSSYGTAINPITVPSGTANTTTTLTQVLDVALAQLRVTGTVRNGLALIPNATVSISGDVYANTTTDSQGIYSVLFDVNKATVDFHIRVNDTLNVQDRNVTVNPAAGQVTQESQGFDLNQTTIGLAKWSYQTSAYIGPRIPAISSDGNIYLSTSNAQFVALDSNGHEKWTKTLVGAMSSPVVNLAGTIYVADSANLYAFDASGNQLWVKGLENDGEATLSLMPDGRVIALTNTRIRRFGLLAGEVEMDAVVPTYTNFAPVVLASGEVLVCRGQLQLLKNDGSQAWQSLDGCSSEIALFGNNAYVADGSSVRSIDLTNGITNWQYPANNASSLLVNQLGQIIFSTSQGDNYSNTMIREVTTISSTGSLIDVKVVPGSHAGNLLLGSDSSIAAPRRGGVQIIDPSVGLTWTYLTPDQNLDLYGSTITNQGQLLVTGNDRLYAINTGLTGLFSAAPWAKVFGSINNGGHN